MTVTVAQTSKSAVAVKAFFRITQAWGLDRNAAATLLAVNVRTIDRWKSGAEPELSRDQLERISYLLGIYGTLHALLGESPFADAWVASPNADFGGRTPIERLLAANVGDLADVNRYVNAWAAGW